MHNVDIAYYIQSDSKDGHGCDPSIRGPGRVTGQFADRVG